MARFEEGLKDIFLAGVGAMALTGEKAKEVVETLIEKGELTVDQGKEINRELQHKAEGTFSKARSEALDHYMSSLSDEERENFAAEVMKLAQAKKAEPLATDEPKEGSEES